ncbi:MAG: AMP-binding protein, partial [Flammeovirgaceae bacterium]
KSSQVKTLLELNPSIHVYNEYGTTETTIGCNCVEIKDPEAISIGFPINDTAVFILDERMSIQPPLFTGELYIGGAGVARGYLNRPDLTAERFVPNPFGEGLLYKSGDLGRYLEDGSIEYLGRIDHQVKLRGYRIELEEIESRLWQLEGVEDAVVLVKGASG